MEERQYSSLTKDSLKSIFFVTQKQLETEYNNQTHKMGIEVTQTWSHMEWPMYEEASSLNLCLILLSQDIEIFFLGI